MGQFTFRYGMPVPISHPARLRVGALCGFINGLLVTQLKLPPFIVTLGTWRSSRRQLLYSRSETIRSQDIEAQAPFLQLIGTQIKIGGAVLHLRRHLDGAAGGAALVHAEPHRLGPPRLCDRRRSRRGASSPASHSTGC